MNYFLETVGFIRSLFNEPEKFIPLHAPFFTGNEKKYLNECIETTFVSSVGKFVNRFENEMANYTKSKFAVVCSNGTNALQISLLVAGVRENHEVITQPLTFVATCNAINYCKANPVFVDVDKDTMGMSPKALKIWLEENSISKNSKTYNKITGNEISACVPMHTFGHPCKIDEIVDICNEYNIVVIEDAAESVGSTYKGSHCGTFGRLSVQSFNGNKIITTGGGGMILTDDEDMAKKAKHLTTTAKAPHKWEYVHDEIGYNFRMPNINAALGCAQLEQIDTFLKSKRDTAVKYNSFFENIKGVDFFIEPKNCVSNYWLNAVILENKESRDHFLSLTNEQGIMTRPIWELMNRLPMFKDCQCGNLKNAEWLADRVVNIPSSVTVLK